MSQKLRGKIFVVMLLFLGVSNPLTVVEPIATSTDDITRDPAPRDHHVSMEPGELSVRFRNGGVDLAL